MDQETKRLLSKAVLTIEEAGTVLGMCRNSAYSAAKRGDIPTIKIGKLLKVRRRCCARSSASKPPKTIPPGALAHPGGET